MERYQVGDEVDVFGRGCGQILAVARPGRPLEEACGPVMAQLCRLSLQGKRFDLPAPNDEDRFRGSLTQYLVEWSDRIEWVPWHLTRRVHRRTKPQAPLLLPIFTLPVAPAHAAMAA